MAERTCPICYDFCHRLCGLSWEKVRANLCERVLLCQYDFGGGLDYAIMPENVYTEQLHSGHYFGNQETSVKCLSEYNEIL